MRFGLKEEVIQKIVAVFTQFPQISEVILYGSRALGTFKNGSDIDLSLKGKDLNLETMNKIANELDDLLLPYTFDLSIYDQISNQDLKKHIDRVGIPFN